MNDDLEQFCTDMSIIQDWQLSKSMIRTVPKIKSKTK